MKRPHFNKSFDQLTELYEAAGNEVDLILAIRDELTFRTTKKARALLSEIEGRLQNHGAAPQGNESSSVVLHTEERKDRISISETPSTLRESKYSPLVGPTAPLEILNGNERIDAPDDLQRPSSFTLIRPPGTAGLPQAYSASWKNDVVFDLPENSQTVDKYIAAVSALLVEIRSSGSGSRRYQLGAGGRLESVGAEYLYSFEFIEEANLFEDAEIEIELGGLRHSGSIVNITAGRIVIAFEDDLGPSVSKAIIVVDSTALLEALVNKLQQVKKGELSLNTALADAVVGKGTEPNVSSVIEPRAPELNRDQSDAYRSALKESITRIWGPPGTGKTHVLATIVEAFFCASKRVLLCSNTNKAVDQILLKICRRLTVEHPALQTGKIIRRGQIADLELKEQFERYITLDGNVDRLSMDLRRRKQEIEEILQEIDKETKGARRLIDNFLELDRLNVAFELIQKEREALEWNVRLSSDRRLAVEQDMSRLQHELANSGGFLRLFKRSPAVIQHHLNLATEERDDALKKIAASKEKIPSLEKLSASAKERVDVAARSLQGEDRAEVSRMIETAESRKIPLLSEMREIERQMAELEASLLKNANVIGVTCTKAYLDAGKMGTFDLVIVDEASMIMPPLVWFCAGLSSERVVVCGDSNQIPPIVQTKQESVFATLGRDVLSVSDEGRRLPQVMLRDQYRMAEEICSLISTPMYDGELRTSDKRLPSENPSLPEPFGTSLIVVDTSELWPFESANAFKSRFNLMHALIARNIAWYLNKEGMLGSAGSKSLGICTPYAAQAKLTQALLAGVNLGDRVPAGTVHRYQGDQCHSIILDIPESHGGNFGLGMFVQGVPPSDVGARLLNVAVSRAEENLIVIANLTYLDRLLPSTALLRSVLYEMQRKGKVLPAKRILELRPLEADLKGIVGKVSLNMSAEKFGLFDESTFDSAVVADIAAAKKTIEIYSGFITPKRVAEYGDLFRAKVAEGVSIRCITRPPHANGSIPVAAGKSALDALEGVGCTVDCRARIHQKVLIFDGSIVWHGSLNALSHTHLTDESMTRVVSEELASALNEALTKVKSSIGSVNGKGIRGENPRCQRCGSRTVFAEGRFGPYFYCEAGKTDGSCTWKANIKNGYFAGDVGRDEHDSESEGTEPVYCPLCGSIAVLRRSPRGQFYGCSKYPKCRGTISLRDL